MSRRKGEAAVDGWSWVHFAAGAGLGLTGVPWWLAAILIVGFEFVEAGLRRIPVPRNSDVKKVGLFDYESWPNVFADVAIGGAGYLAVALFMGFHGWGLWRMLVS